MYLIDTNIITEVRKGRRCDGNVAAWYRATRDDELFLSVLVVGEIRQGIERVRPRNLRQAAALENWLDEILRSFSERVLPVNERVAQSSWARIASASIVSARAGSTRRFLLALSRASRHWSRSAWRRRSRYRARDIRKISPKWRCFLPATIPSGSPARRWWLMAPPPQAASRGVSNSSNRIGFCRYRHQASWDHYSRIKIACGRCGGTST